MKILFLFSIILTSAAFSFTLNSTQRGWAAKTLKINLNPANCPSDILERLEDAFKTWNSVPTSSLKLSLGSTESTTTAASLMAATASDSPVVICETQFATVVETDANVVSGVGFGAGQDESKPLTYGGLLLNVQTGASANVNNLTATQRAIVITHEIGHVLGLGHSSYEPALMYFSVGIKSNLSLSKDDWDGMAYLYPRDEVGQTDLTAGCGRVKNSQIRPQTGQMVFVLMIAPLLLLAFLRRRVRVSSSISK